MAWDFSTEHEFQRKLDWIRSFVDEEIIPIELYPIAYTKGTEFKAAYRKPFDEVASWNRFE